VSYQGARQSYRLRGRGGPLLKLGLVRIDFVGILRLEGVVVSLLPLRLHVGLVGVVAGVVAGVAALFLLLDLVLRHMVEVLIKIYILIVEKRADPHKQEVRVQKDERFEDPEKIHGSQRQIKMWETRGLRTGVSDLKEE
jgi:hypothetical protein